MAEDDIYIEDVLGGVADAFLVENYPDYPKWPCVLVLQYDSSDCPVHVVWGIPKGYDSPAVLVTAYRPSPDKWSKDYTRRIK